MKLINQILTLAPTPLFIIGGTYSWINPGVCSAGSAISEMTIMWSVMALAHLSSWVIFLERRRYTRLQQLPERQQ
jgi:hypothetical protein